MFSERLKALRSEKKLTQNELATELGISNKTISVYEKGTSFPNFETLKKIAFYFGVTSDYLIGYSDIRNPTMSQISVEIGLSSEAIKTVIEQTKDRLDIISPLLENSNFVQFLTYAKAYTMYPFMSANNMLQTMFDGLPENILKLSPQEKQNLVNTALKSTATDCLVKALDEISVRILPPTTE